jgi:hypothetical protein
VKKLSPHPALPRLIRVIVESVRGNRRNAWVTICHVAGEAEASLRQKACQRYRQLAGVSVHGSRVTCVL